MSSNSIGGTLSTAASLRAFDRLPPALRAAFRDAAEKWACQTIHKKFEAGRLTLADAIGTVRRWDRQELEQRADQRARAVGPYKGNAKEAAGRKVRP